MSKKLAETELKQSTPETTPIDEDGNFAPPKDKPVHEIRIGRIKAVVWSNRTENGVRHNVTLRRIFKRDQNAQWEQSDVFGRDDLLLVAEVCRLATLWIFDQGQGSQVS